MAFADDSRTGQTPERVDLRPFLWPVEHTGTLYAAAASAAVTALEYHCNRMNEPPTNLSSMFVYYNARKLRGFPETNKGTTVADALKAIAAYGACREASWPLDEQGFAKEPPASAYSEAKKFAGVNYYATSDAFKSLELGYPVPFAARMPVRCLREAGVNGGVFPSLTAEEIQAADSLPVHAMTLVGYDKSSGTFLVRNCWGSEWGDKGHCTIGFETMEVCCPAGTDRLWVLTLPEVAKGAEPAAASQQPETAAQPEAAATAAQDLSKRLRDEIRGGLDRDLAEARKRIQDQVRRPGGRS
jgi:hypothetical protein